MELQRLLNPISDADPFKARYDVEILPPYSAPDGFNLDREVWSSRGVIDWGGRRAVLVGAADWILDVLDVSSVMGPAGTQRASANKAFVDNPLWVLDLLSQVVEIHPGGPHGFVAQCDPRGLATTRAWRHRHRLPLVPAPLLHVEGAVSHEGTLSQVAVDLVYARLCVGIEASLARDAPWDEGRGEVLLPPVID